MIIRLFDGHASIIYTVKQNETIANFESEIMVISIVKYFCVE